jgi:hypothetical protein
MYIIEQPTEKSVIFFSGGEGGTSLMVHIQVKSNTLLSLGHLNVQEDVKMRYIHTTDGRQIN